MRGLGLSVFGTLQLREKSKKQKTSPGHFDARGSLNTHRSLLTSGDLPILSLEAGTGRASRMLGFLTREFGFQPPSLAGDAFYWSCTTRSFPSASAELSIACIPCSLLLPWLMPVLLSFETSNTDPTQGSIIQSHFQFLLDSLRSFPPRASCMGVSNRLLWHCRVPCQPCPLSPAMGIFGLPGATHQCPGKQWGKQQKSCQSFVFLSCFDNPWQESG